MYQVFSANNDTIVNIHQLSAVRLVVHRWPDGSWSRGVDDHDSEWEGEGGCRVPAAGRCRTVVKTNK